jgi:hypothetical protein
MQEQKNLQVLTFTDDYKYDDAGFLRRRCIVYCIVYFVV